MAVACRVLSVAKSSRYLLMPLRFDRLLCNTNTNSTSASSSNPLISRLLQVPVSQIKTTLDSVDIFAFNSFQFSWDALITSLQSSSPKKAQLVLEWRLDKMLKGNESCLDEYACLIALSGKVQNVPFAMHVFTSMEAQGIKPNSAVFNSLICACLCSGFSSLGNVDAMNKWYAAKTAAGFSANVQTYESLIHGSLKARDFDSVDRFYEEMMSLGIIPSIPILEKVLEGLCARRKLDQVKSFLKFLLGGGWKINENMAQKLVKCYCEHGRVDELEELLETLTKCNQSPEVLLHFFSGIIRLYALSDRLDDVEYSVGRMGKQGLSFKSAEDVEMVICSYFRCEAYDRLNLFLDHIKGSNKLRRATYDFLVAGYRRAGLSEKLDSVINEMKFAEYM
ncbi:hypothetical protein AB3S75_018945 [Citrus x aurantiifolia]